MVEYKAIKMRQHEMNAKRAKGNRKTTDCIKQCKRQMIH